jgi:hypothetical protein
VARPTKATLQRGGQWRAAARTGQPLFALPAYSERQVNDILQAWHSFGDHSLLRRELCDRGLLARDTSGIRYWKPDST